MELLKGSGWYLPDFKTAEPYFWGKSEGCSIA
jgi:predicted nucleic acid-binding Zn ribbon protein